MPLSDEDQALIEQDFNAQSLSYLFSGGYGPMLERLLNACRLEERAKAEGETLQSRVQPWMMACFGPEIAADRLERNDRFMEEAIELVQASGYAKERVYALADYVYGRPQGEINQEVGGVMITLAAHCLAHGVDMHQAGEDELARIWTMVEKIRAKQATKPVGSALPMVVETAEANLAKAEARIAELEGMCGKLSSALEKIDAIRNSIIGLQKMDWSEHIYPLVAALDQAGFEGMEYPEARANYGTMLQRAVAAEARATQAEELVREVVGDADTLANCFAWSAVTADCDDSRHYLHSLIVALRKSLAKLKAAPLQGAGDQ